MAKILAEIEPDEFLKFMVAGFQNKMNKLGLLSLSATNNNVLLWSHYAANHTGLCLVFQATDITPFFGRSRHVEYLKTYPEIDLLNHTTDEQAQAFLLTKAKDWEYEDEWRIIELETGSGAKSFPEELLVGIIFGLRMNEKDKADVIKWVNQRNSDIQLSQASLISGSFSLKIVPYRS